MSKNVLREHLVIFGASWGGINALKKIFCSLPVTFQAPIVVLLHQQRNADSGLIDVLSSTSTLAVRSAEEKEKPQAGTIYIAPANYHLLIEEDGTFSFCVAPKVNFCRPSIDVLLESAADVYRGRLIAVVLTGANSDGAAGAKYVKRRGGVLIVQSPADAEMPVMPQAVMDETNVDFVLNINEITQCLSELIASRYRE